MAEKDTEHLELEFSPSGTIRTIYKDGDTQALVNELEGTMTVARASNVEWEKIGTLSGWTVRAAWNPNLAIRFKENAALDDLYKVSEEGDLAVFTSRFEALSQEVKLFWDLIPKEKL